MNRVFRLLRPSHQHTAFSATLLLMTAVLLSRVIGYIREAYIAWAFGAGPATDAYVAGFTIPDWLNYLVAGGTASITFVSIYTRFLAENREEDAQKTFSVIIPVMTAVLGIGIVLAEIFTPQISRHLFSGFTAGNLSCVFTSHAFCFQHRSSSTWAESSPQYSFPGGYFCSPPSDRCSITQLSFWAGCCCRDELASPHWHMAPWQAVFLGRS